MLTPLKPTKKMVEPLKTGELLVKEGFISTDDIETALSIQKNRQTSMSIQKNRLLGMILCDLNLITPVNAYYVLYKYNKIRSIQSELISNGLLAKEDVLKISELAKQQRLPLISLLLKTGRISPDSMQKLLFDLFHIPLKPVPDLSFKPEGREKMIKVMDAGLSKKNRIVPLELKDNTLNLGITDPYNLLFIHQLSERFPQYRFKPVFVPYEGFWQLNKRIYDTEAHKASSRDESLDLSLLLKYKTTISDPEIEKGSIQTLYHRYEQVRLLTGKQSEADRLEEFSRFIRISYEKISREYQSRQIEFSLRKEAGSVCLIALPIREE